MIIELSEMGNICHLKLTSSERKEGFTSSMLEKIHRKVDSLTKFNDGKDYVMELIDIDYIDSSGIGLLLSIYKTVSKGGGKLTLVSISESLRHVCRQVNLHHIIRIVESTEEALAPTIQFKLNM